MNNSKPRFKQTEVYQLVNRLLLTKGLTKGTFPKQLNLVLDIGCGRALDILSLLTMEKAHKIVIGLDIRPYREWKRVMLLYGQVNFVIADALYLPFRSQVFGFCFLRDLLHHIRRDFVNVIQEALKVVRISGILRVIEANRYHINSILVFKHDVSHDHFTFKELNMLKKHLSFDELYGLELLPSFSCFKKDFLWNCFVIIFWLLTTWPKGVTILLLYIKLKEKFLKNNLTYYVLSKKRVREIELE
ncbi:MAG: class I SAM-dependent methyltransferase [Candidatus Bathyarchaeia archaeon]